MPVAAAIGAFFGATGAGAATVGAGVLAGGALAGTAAIVSAASQKKAATLGQITPDATQTVGGGTNTTANANNAGRAALISTSPSGVQGIDPTGRRKLIGND